MRRIEEIVEIAATPQQVWAVAADATRFGEWLTMHRSWQGGPPTDIAAGDRATALVRVAGMPVKITWTVEEYTAPSRVRLRGKAPAGVEVAVAFDIAASGSGDDASTVTISAQFDGRALIGPVGRAIERDGRRELRTSATRLRELLT